MKILVKSALVSTVLVSSLYATNGDNLIATGAKSRSMGGVGIAKGFGAESGLSNPALLSIVKKSEISGSLTFFMPEVQFDSSLAGTNRAAQTSNSGFSIIPEISYAQRINDNVVYGVSITGTAGMGVDYDDSNFGGTGDNGSMRMKTEIQLMKVAVPFSYETNSISIGFSPVIQYGTLQMSHLYDTSGVGSGPYELLDNGKSSDSSYGYEIGVVYDMKELGVEGLTLGAVYKSEIEMTYQNTIASSIAVFGGALTGISSGDNLYQPAEIGLGLSYASGKSTIAIDYKNVAWSDTSGYADFGWQDQDIIAIGYEYITSQWAVRLGYNHGNNPVEEQVVNNTATDYSSSVKNFFNLAGFPGVVETHYTFGGSYLIEEGLELDFAVVYAAETTENYDISALDGSVAGSMDANVVHSQLGVTVGASYKF